MKEVIEGAVSLYQDLENERYEICRRTPVKTYFISFEKIDFFHDVHMTVYALEKNIKLRRKLLIIRTKN